MQPNARKRTIRFSALCTLCFLFLIFSQAGRAEDAFVVPSLRSLSLGEAMTGVADDDDLLFYNPAGLAMIDESRLTLIGLRANFNTDTLDTISEFSDAYDKAKRPRGGESYERIDNFPQTTLDKLKELNPLARVAGPLQITYIRRGFAISLINPEIVGRIDVDPSGSEIQVRGRGDVLGMISYARRNIYRNLSAGLTLKYLVRSEIGEGGVGPKLTEVLGSESDVVLKYGLGFDIGLSYQMGEALPLTIGVAILDFAGTNLTTQTRKLDGFDQVGKDGESKIDQRFALGVSYRPDFKFPLNKLAYMPEDFLIALAFTSGESMSERVHIGVEMKPYRWLALRFGVNDGVRFGVGLRSTRLALDYMFAPSLQDNFIGDKTEGNHAVSLIMRY